MQCMCNIGTRIGIGAQQSASAGFCSEREMPPPRAHIPTHFSPTPTLLVHGPNGSPYPSSEFEHSSIPATVKKLFILRSGFLTKRDAWAGTFETIFQKRTSPRTDCLMQLPTPSRIRTAEANEEAKLTDFQQELQQLAAVLVGHHYLTSFPSKIGQNMTVREGEQYMEDAVKRFLDAGLAARKMGVDENQIVKMRPSLTTRPKHSTTFP